MKKLLTFALIMQICTLSYAIDDRDGKLEIIDLPGLDGLIPPDVNTAVLIELVKSLHFATLGKQRALATLQDILKQTADTANCCEQSTHQLTSQQKVIISTTSKL